MAQNTQHKVRFAQSSHLMKRLDCVGFSDVFGTSTTRLVVGVISAMVEMDRGKTLALTP